MAYVGAALVYDSSFFGATAPILGQSYRLEVSPDRSGSLNYYSVLADYRKYIMPVKPFTLAFRVMHYGRYGKGADDERLWPMFLGYDWYIRGYDYNSFTGDEVDRRRDFDLNRLFGSKMMVANFELRFPLFGALGSAKASTASSPWTSSPFTTWAWPGTIKPMPWFVGAAERENRSRAPESGCG